MITLLTRKLSKSIFGIHLLTAAATLCLCGTLNAAESATKTSPPVQGKELAKMARGATRFGSFDEARAALKPEGGAEVELMTNPMSLKNRVIMVRLQLLQVLSDGKMLLTNPYMGVPQLDGKIYYAYLPSTYTGSRDFVDGLLVDIVAEVTGTHQYTTAIGTAKTVPEIRIYGIRASQ